MELLSQANGGVRGRGVTLSTIIFIPAISGSPCLSVVEIPHNLHTVMYVTVAQRAPPHTKPINIVCVTVDCRRLYAKVQLGKPPSSLLSTGAASLTSRYVLFHGRCARWDLWAHAHAPPWVFQWPTQRNPSSRGTPDDFTEMFLHTEVSSLLHALGRTGPHEHVLWSERYLSSRFSPAFCWCVRRRTFRISTRAMSLRRNVRLTSRNASRAPAIRRKSASTRTTSMFTLITICLSASLLSEILTSASVPSRSGTRSREERLCRNFSPGCPTLDQSPRLPRLLDAVCRECFLHQCQLGDRRLRTAGVGHVPALDLRCDGAQNTYTHKNE